ncbi:tRNA (5-methylaminomethyl-2-thiouridylate)-methyltransferase [Saprospira grandis DSM 2844]|uniref:tRNA-specific 2-thiouridylase MnmA n=1 Tax=Saprospira grandis DSM 2844 TaxID=694433 RepID=J1I7X9_9BACT|nr:tRNA (5-methylaminomethyl-2-thiouridylate)-methyltransferase [Saprospira grandis DSM 2844]
MNGKRVVVGLSGGVDSSVTAYLLLEQGYEVIGLFMRNWNDDSVIEESECPWIEDSNDALLVAQELGIPFQVVDLSEDYKERIVNYMFAEYEAGRTPNPDVLCNREIKFDVFLEKALELGADYVATGHYCQKTSIEKGGQLYHQLKAGADPNKDQSYFLCQLSQQQLAKALFPIGHLQKSEVREIAKEQGLITAEKKDSQGLCFVGKIKLPVFLQQQLAPKTGQAIELAADSPIFKPAATDDLADLARPYPFSPDLGKVVGEHTGAHFFTVGQRKGLQLGGFKEPLFVLHTDTEKNIVYVGQGKQHPGLYRPALFIPKEDAHWLRPDLRLKAGEKMSIMARIRYRQALQKAALIAQEEGLYFLFEEAQRGVTPGQFAAAYLGDELVFSGVIQ